MSTSATPQTQAKQEATTLQEWLVIAPDYEGALEKRLKARPEHIKGLGSDGEGFWLWGGEFFSLLFFGRGREGG